MALPSLVLAQSAIPTTAANRTDTLKLGVRDKNPILLSAAGDNIHILDDQANLIQSLPFELAFPIHSRLQDTITALGFDLSSGRFAAASAGRVGVRVGVWEPASGTSWRVHSSFTIPHRVSALDYARGRIVAGGDIISLWELDEAGLLPTWRRIGSESPSTAVLSARLSPSANTLATVASGSTAVRLSSVSSSTSGQAVRFLSHAWHSLRIRSIGWRPTDDLADSGPILFTTTLDGVFRFWGCMIDEPNFFSLWATLDVHTTLPYHIPLATCFRRTRQLFPVKDGEERRKGTKDDFVTVFSDGSAWTTTVENFDCRPPACLVQSSSLLHPTAFAADQLANLRHTLLIPSTSSPTELSLLCRCSRGSLILSDLSAPSLDEPPFSSAPEFLEPPRDIPVNFTGRIRELILSDGGESILARGSNSHLQNWELDDDDDLIVETYVADRTFEEDAKVATWHDGKMLAVASSTGLAVYGFQNRGRLHAITSSPLPLPLPALSTFFVARASVEAISTTIIAITSSSEVLTWTYNSATHALALDGRQELVRSGMKLALPVPPRRPTADWDVVNTEVKVLVVDVFGGLTFWSAGIEEGVGEWRKGTSVRTGREQVARVACSVDGISAVVARTEGGKDELSIWDSKASEFTSGEQFSQELAAPIVDLDWSPNGESLALATCDQVLLLCAQRLDNLSDRPSWITYASISVNAVTAAPISHVCWLSSGLAVASGEALGFYSSKITDGTDCHELAAERIAPLPYHHPQLLFQSLLHGRTEAVIKVLAGLAAQLTDEGDLTPIKTTRSMAAPKIRLEDFLTKRAGDNEVLSTAPNDIFSALTKEVAHDSNGSLRPMLTEEDYHRLLGALKKYSMRGLTQLEHRHLAVVVQTVFDIQRQQGSLDANGLRFLVSMRSFFIYNAGGPSTTAETLNIPRLKYRNAVWAFHSDNQELLIDASAKACPSKITWEHAKALNLFLWIKSPELLSAQMETVGRSEYIKPDSDDKDPISASIFYLALRKKHMVVTLWKQAGGHADQRSMLKLLANDFELPRWRSAALKNAFALISKRRFLFAAAFFILGDSIKDAVSVCLRNLDDFQLAIALTRVYEGDDGPVLRSILEDTVLPFAFQQGSRWLASWAFWMLKRRDLAIQTIVTPLANLAARLPYRLGTIGRPLYEDPCLVLLFAQLRSWSLQTVKGATAVAGHTEFNFVLHMSRVLTRMGCHILALDLVRSWEFIIPRAPVRAPRSSVLLDDPGRRRQSLRRQSTKLDLHIPSNLASRAASPERERAGGVEFHQVMKETKKAAQAPPEFDMNSFAF